MNKATLRKNFLSTYRPTQSKKDLAVVVGSYATAALVWWWAGKQLHNLYKQQREWHEIRVITADGAQEPQPTCSYLEVKEKEFEISFFFDNGFQLDMPWESAAEYDMDDLIGLSLLELTGEWTRIMSTPVRDDLPGVTPLSLREFFTNPAYEDF